MRIACPRRFGGTLESGSQKQPRTSHTPPLLPISQHSKRLLSRALYFLARQHARTLELSGPATSRSRRSESVAWAIGGSGWYGSMTLQHDNHSTPAIPAALDPGLNWIETAALYGLGHSGEMLTRAIEGRSPKPYVFTKCERVWDENGNIGACLKARSVRRGCKDSLRRLKLTRSISTKSTGRSRRRHRRRLDRVSAPEGRQGSMDRSV
jgi:hypothetical protein